MSDEVYSLGIGNEMLGLNFYCVLAFFMTVISLYRPYLLILYELLRFVSKKLYLYAHFYDKNYETIFTIYKSAIDSAFVRVF